MVLQERAEPINQSSEPTCSEAQQKSLKIQSKAPLESTVRGVEALVTPPCVLEAADKRCGEVNCRVLGSRTDFVLAKKAPLHSCVC